MTKKITPLVSLVVIGMAFLIDFFYRQSLISREIYKTIAEPLFYLASSVFAVSIILLFLKDEIFYVWRRFATWWMLASILFVLIIPDSGNGFFVSMLSKETLSLSLSVLFFVVSIILIIYKSMKLRGK